MFPLFITKLPVLRHLLELKQVWSAARNSMERRWKRKQRAEVTESLRPDEEATQQEKRRERRPPLLALTFVRKATGADSSIGVEELCNRIYGGVLMNDNKLVIQLYEWFVLSGKI